VNSLNTLQRSYVEINSGSKKCHWVELNPWRNTEISSRLHLHNPLIAKQCTACRVAKDITQNTSL